MLKTNGVYFQDELFLVSYYKSTINTRFSYSSRSYFVSCEGYTKEKTQPMTIANSVLRHI